MSKRFAAVFTSLAMLFLASCDNASDRAKQATPAPTPAPGLPPTAAVAPPASQPAPAPVPQDTMAKPPGTNPAKLAEHAKALQELGYQAEAAKLYEHACEWGYAPACAQAKAEASQAARPPMPAQTAASVAQSKPPAAAMAKPTPSPMVAQATAPAPASHVAQPAASPAMPPAAPPPAPMPPAAAPASPPAAPIVQAAIKPMAVPASPAKPAPVDTRKLSQQAHGLENLGYVPVAITLYKDACHAGDGLSCKRLGEIYIKGIDGVQRDYAESVRWYDRARKLGVEVPSLEKRTVYR